MENYKTYSYKSETSEILDIETKIPTYIVNKIEQALIDMQGYCATPVLINPKDMSVVYGIIDRKDNTLKYRVSIMPEIPLSN